MNVCVCVCVCVSTQNIYWSRKWKPTLVFLPEESHGQRSLAGYGPWDRKELDTTKVISIYIYIYIYIHIKLSRFPLQQKLTQHCKSIILQKGSYKFEDYDSSSSSKF